MKKIVVIAIGIAFTYLSQSNAFAVSDGALCSQLSDHVYDKSSIKLPDPSRQLTPDEELLVSSTSIDLLETLEYSNGARVVDINNDGKSDVFVWAIQGSGRYVYAEFFDVTTATANSPRRLKSLGRMELGVLQDPRFIRFKGVNYVISTTSGDRDGTVVNRVSTLENGRSKLQTVCKVQILVKSQSTCRHAACKKLRGMVDDITSNESFVNVEWPHKSASPNGIRIFSDDDYLKDVDFDNSTRPTSIWRADIFELGQSGKFRPQLISSDSKERLRRTLFQQSEVLSKRMQKPLSVDELINIGSFFMFEGNGGRTYWAWDLDQPPYGAEMHIVYTNQKRTDYIGIVRIERTSTLVPSISQEIDLSSDR